MRNRAPGELWGTRGGPVYGLPASGVHAARWAADLMRPCPATALIILIGRFMFSPEVPSTSTLSKTR